MLTMRNIEDGLATTGDLEPVSVTLRDVTRFQVHAGDLIASVRGTFKVAVVTPEHAGAIAGANTAVMRLRNLASGLAVAAYLRHPEVTNQLQQAFVGSTVPGISLEDLRTTQLALPCPEKLDQLTRLIEAGETYYAAMQVAATSRRQLMLETVRRSLSGDGETA